MQVKYMLFVIYCAVPLLLHRADSQEYCRLNNTCAFCSPSAMNRTINYVPRISQRITEIFLDFQPLNQLPRNAFRNVSSQSELTTINLFTCQIQHIDADAFMNLDNLEFLHMTFNGISRLETGTFQHTKQLKELYMDGNKIDKLQTGLFHNLVHLKKVSFQLNGLKCIDKDTFRNTPSLFSIQVQYNELEYLSPLFTDNFFNITELYVHRNRWNCDCNLKEFYEKYKVTMPDYPDTDGLSCDKPRALRFTKWLDLTSDDFKCDARIISPTNDTRVVTLGSIVTLSCAVHSDSTPHIRWHKGSHIISLDNMFISSNMNMHYLNYTFTVQQDDLGMYQCIVNNTRKGQVFSTTLTMDDTSSKAVTELVPRTTEPVSTCKEPVPRDREPVPVNSIREFVSTITNNEPAIIIKESGSRIKELSTSNGPNATTTVEVTMNVVLQVPKNLE